MQFPDALNFACLEFRCFCTPKMVATLYIYTFRGKWKIGDAARERIGKVHLGYVL